MAPGPQRQFDSVANNAFAVTPDSSNDLLYAPAEIYIGVAGDIVVDTIGGSKRVLFKNHPIGYMPVACSRVYGADAGTTADSIVGLY